MNKTLKNGICTTSALLLACFFFAGCINNNSTSTSTDKPIAVDIDKDGIPNVIDPDIDNDGIPNTSDNDMDGDGIINDKDSDANGNGVPDNTENDYTSGLGVVALDTVGYALSLDAIQKNSTVSTTQMIDLDDVRDEIKKNDIVLSTFSLTDLSIIASESNSFIQANATTRIVLKVFYMDQDNKILILESAAAEGLAGPVLTIGDLSQGIELNKEIFGSSPGFTDFSSMIKDETKASVATVVEITFLDDPSQGATNIGIDFILKSSGKKAS